MLLVFHKDVAKVDRDVAHVAIGHTRMFQVYVLNVSSVLDVCCKCFIWMLQIEMLHIYASVSGVFIRMLQVFHLDVCNGYTRVFKYFLGILQVFQTHVASVSADSDVCCKCFI
jgi:ABC-type siderophore export system fused ATPase/permease subunit